MLDTGLRAVEALRVELRDIDWARRRIQVRHGMGRRQRVAPFGPETAAALAASCDGFRGTAPGCFFQTARGPRRPLHLFALTGATDSAMRRTCCMR